MLDSRLVIGHSALVRLDGNAQVHRMSTFGMSRLLRDARDGVVATGRLLRASGKRPFGWESSMHRLWILPAYLAIVAPLPLIGTALGSASGPWWPALLALLVLGLASMVLFARLGRTFHRDYPDA